MNDREIHAGKDRANANCYPSVSLEAPAMSKEPAGYQNCLVSFVVSFDCRSFWKLALVSLILCVLAFGRAQAADARLEWDANSEPDLAGYRLHYGTASGGYSMMLDVGFATSATVPNLTAGQTYFFVVTAYNTSGLESPASNEVNFTALEGPNQPPAVAISGPVEGSVFVAPASIHIFATASDNDGVVSLVEFFSGDVKLGEMTSSPFEIVWNSAAPGTYELTAVVTDNLGATARSAPVVVIVNAPPAVSLTNYTSGNVAPATIILEAAVSDVDGSVTRVEFYNGSEKLGEQTAAPFSWTVNSAPAGTYALRALAVDDRGATTWSNEVLVTVVATNANLAVALTDPQPGTSFIAPATINISAAANGANGTIDRIEFFSDGISIGTSSLSPFTIQWMDVPSGTYNLTAVAYDTSGASATSPSVRIIVNASPQVSLSLSRTSDVVAGGRLTLLAAASDPDGSIRRVEFYSGTILLGKDMNTPHQFTWNKVRAGTHVFTAVAYDDQGAATRSAPLTVTVAPGEGESPSIPILPRVQPLGRGYDGAFELELVGATGDIYDVWYSEDLKNWSLLLSVLNSEGIVTVSDPDADPSGTRFYRVSLR